MTNVTLGMAGAVGHDPAAALIVDGKVVAAVEEERLIRRKHAVNELPYVSARTCLQIAGLRPDDVTHVAIPFAPAVDTLVTAFLTGLSLLGLLPSMVFTSFWMSSHFIFCFFLMYSSFQNKSPSHNKQSRFVAYAGFNVSGVPCLPSLLWPKAIGMHTDGGLHHGALSPWGWLLIPEQPCVPTWA